MASVKSSNVSVEPFDGRGDFTLWKQRVKSVLTREGTIKALKVKVQRTEKMTDAEWAKHRKNDKPEKLSEEEWEDLKDMATSTICLCLANNTLREVLGLTDPVDIWDKLESRYKSKSLTTKGAGRERGRSKERGGASQRFKSSSKSFRCYYCDEEGHFKRDCPKRRKEKKDGKTPVTAVAESSNQESEEDLFLATTKSLGKSDWILDSGCSFHMCSVKEKFDTYQTCDGGAVKMANGARSKIAGVGTVQVGMFDGVVRTLTGVKHVPGLKGNLISLGALDSEGCRIFAQGGVLKISRGAMVVAKGVLSKGLYKLVEKDLTRKLSEGRITSATSGAFAWKKRVTFEASRIGGYCDLTEMSRVEPDHELEGVNERLHSLGQALEACQAEYNSLKTELLILKQVVSSTVRTSADVVPSKIKVLEPKHFDGARNAKELENFLLGHGRIFQGCQVPGREKVSIAQMYLMGDAKLWWCGRVIDDANSGRMGIEPWEGLKKELKAQFLPHNVSWMARENLKKLKQTRSLREYVKEFSSLMLDIQNMSEDDKLLNFMSGLHNWAQAEHRRLAVKNLPTAMAEAEILVDFKTMAPQGKKGEHPKKEEKAKSDGKTKSKKKGGDGKAPAEGGKKEKAQAGCWTCGGDHFQRNRPQGPKINAMVEEGTWVSNSIPARCSPYQLCSTMHESAHNFVNRGLMYVLVVVNGVELLAMIDTGASHNFVTERLLGRLQLKLEGNSSMIKTVNAAAKEVTGRAYVKIKVGEWQGECSLTVLPLDDFDLILGNEFLIMAKAVVFPYLGGMMIND
ncbi:unnamed protein product [Cuscuta campestris]|uniref:CCHC-type domain-containing protein n=1 Tax=Cuscuta campestris TaxID=132261 RepID=A0A484N7C6_9ASTE|nr:unnamed protein product [Cuscuta campestris]